ncbi:polyadenylate-binding protein 2-like [Toxorhynchites rutilus septentrionalis]|uniref:polyadenylate-binding protein 2-like n=1 Tax=Toxorhynchites rutilus septentrionalis TaxID=329112 RepID=UPI00247849DA|nr:polyadenylate-binding protein 2-like [Toxorhynchites rutilus septentrionalis]
MADERFQYESSISNDDHVEPDSVEDAVTTEMRELDEQVEEIEARVKSIEEEHRREINRVLYDFPSEELSVSTGIDQRIETDTRSIYIGNVDYDATTEELEDLFRDCGTINRVTIRRNIVGQSKGFGYIEFDAIESVALATAMTGTLFRGRQIKVEQKRTNQPGMSTSNRFSRQLRGRESPMSSRSSRATNSRYRGRATFYEPY